MSVQSIVDQVSWIKRPQGQDAQADRSLTDTVSAIIERVKAEGDEALKAFSQQFDKVVPAQFEVTAHEIETALSEMDPQTRRDSEFAIQQCAALPRPSSPPCSRWRLKPCQASISGTALFPSRRWDVMCQGAATRSSPRR